MTVTVDTGTAQFGGHGLLYTHNFMHTFKLPLPVRCIYLASYLVNQYSDVVHDAQKWRIAVAGEERPGEIVLSFGPYIALLRPK